MTEESAMTAKVGTDELLGDLQSVVRDAEALLQATATLTGEKVESVRAKAQASLHQAKARLAGAQGEALQQVREAAASADEYVHKNPWQAVGVAAGVGFVLGLLISRR